MAKIDITSVAEPLNTGILQLQNGVPMDATLRNVADQNDTTSPLKLSTTAVQVVSPLRITTDDPSDMYLDCEDGATNNRFNITRNTASQQVNLNFASNPIGSTTIVGAIRTYVDGVNLSEVMSFREDGKVGVGTTTPVNLLSVDATNSTLTTEHTAAAATIKSTVQSPLRVLRTGGQPNVWIGTSSTTPNASSFLFGIRTGAYYNTATPTYSGDYAAWIVSRGNDWGAATLASDLRMSQLFTCNGNNGRAALAIYPIPVETATNTDMVNMNNLLIATAGVFTAQPIARLQIIGDGSTAATTSLLVQNGNGNPIFQATDDRTFTTNGLVTRLSSSEVYCGALALNSNSTGATGTGIYSTGTDGKVVIATSRQGALIANYAGALINLLNSDNPKSVLQIASGFTNGNTDGLTGNTLYLTPQYNFTGASLLNTVRGIYYNPTLTSLVSTTHIAFENTTGDVLLNTTSGNTLIGSSASNTAKLSIKGSGSTSATTSLLVQNSSGSQIFKIDDTGTISVPLSGSGVYRNVLVNNNGSAIIGSMSNDYLYFAAGFSQVYLFSTSYLNLQSPYIKGNATQGSNASAFTYVIDMNAYGNTSLPLKFNNYSGNVVFQSSGSGIIHNTEVTLNFDTGGGGPRTLRAYYYNPNFIQGPQSYDKHYAWQNTLGAMIVNSSTPQDSAILQADSTTQGFLPPRMTTAEKNAIVAPAIGLMVFDTTLGRPCFYNGAWVTL